MKLKYQFFIQELNGRYAAVAAGKDAGKFNGVLMVNEHGKAILENLQNEITREELIAALARQFDADEASVSASVDAFTAKLSSQDLLA